MSHSIHSLATSHHSIVGAGKQHPMHQQLLHTLQHQHPHHQSQQQPLVGANNSQHQQTMLQFHHHSTNSNNSSTSGASQQASATLHHPYSTLSQHHSSAPSHHQTLHHNLSLNQQQQQHHLQPASNNTMHFAPATLSQQQQYNMNSDYSSSTYHIYDQISDLIIVKQQRMERKRQLEQRRKVIFLALAATLLVGSLLFLIMQTLLSTGIASASSSSSQQQQQVIGNEPQLDYPPARSDDFASRQQQQPPMMMSDPNIDSATKKLVILPSGDQVLQQPHQDSSYCSGHGQLVISTFSPSSLDTTQLVGLNQNNNNNNNHPATSLCKCEPGFYGDRCEFVVGGAGSAIYQPPNNQLVARCMVQTNYCSGHGQCNSLGRCQCYPGFTGPQCEFRNLMQGAPALPLPPMLPAAAQDAAPATVAPKLTAAASGACRNNCNGQGQCSASTGRCKCYVGFTGDACQERDLCHEQSCSRQGTCDPLTGMCQCKFGFTGLQCELRDDLAWRRLANCSQHGKFDYKLERCVCERGFGGLDCSEERCDTSDEQQQLDCGPNGLFDCRQGKCLCQDGYSGTQCQLQQCSAQCLRNGQCVNGQCVCQPGYYGRHCSLNGCPSACSGRGQCVRVPEAATANQQVQSQQQALQAEWRCQCQAGSMGDDCSQLAERNCDDGIDNDGDGLVDCADSECCGDRVCQNSTLCMKSPDPLDILMRKQPPPPTSSFFQRMQFLIEKASSQMYSNLRDFNDSIMVTRYVDRASVIRGKVTYQKQGITGVRVSVAGQLNLGMTLTRDGGFFDLMVNGGGAVLIEFRREPFATQKKAVRVPWNEIVLMDPVELSIDSTPSADASPTAGPQDTTQAAPSCMAHNYRAMRPLIVSAPNKSSRRSRAGSRSTTQLHNNKHQQQNSRAVILRDSGMVQQSIALPASSPSMTTSSLASQSALTNDELSSQLPVSLVYISSRANEFMSTISLQLTPQLSEQFKQLPQELKLIHLKISIEGNLFEQVFEPQTNLSFTYAWNRRNVYRQKSFGLSTASVSVGYEYFDCQHIVWSNKHVQLAGHDLSISDIGNQWNLNIHHRYNYRDSILQRGDGHNFNLKTDKPRVVQPIMGDGYQRQTLCPYCDGASAPLTEQRLLKPQALVSAPDGSLIVGDSNLIRRIEQASPAQRIVRTVLELPASRVPGKYSLALSLVDTKLYMSDTDRHQIYLVREQESGGGKQPSAADSSMANDTAAYSSSEESLIAVVGNGLKCQQVEDLRNNCGDGQSAQAASLIEPKALAFDLENRMYIADGPNVRMVDTDNRIYTILGDYSGATRHTKFPCAPGEAIPMHKFVPRNPLDLAISPIDDTLHVLDDNVVYKITKDKRVQIVAGRLAHCLATQSTSSSANKQSVVTPKATEVFLQSAQAIAFNQNGDLFISEDDDQKQMISRVLLVVPDEDSISLYAGLPLDPSAAAAAISKQGQQASTAAASIQPTVDSIHLASAAGSELEPESMDKQRSSNALPMSHTATKATDYKFNSVAAIALDQQGNLIVADRVQLRILSVEPDLPLLNSAGEYEIQSPDNGDELLVFNRHGHHVATRDISAGGQVSHSRAASNNKYTFFYNVNTSLGQLASVSYASGNKISIYRDGPHHMVRMIETAFGGQCKLDISRHGQVHSISIMAPNASKTNLSYHVDGGLLKQSRDQASGEMFEFSYDEFGRANGIQHSSSKLPVPVDCRTTGNNFMQHQQQHLQQQARYAGSSSSIKPTSANLFMNQLCSQLIVAE